MSQIPPDNIIPFDGSSDGIPKPRFTPKGIGEFTDAPLLTWIVKQVIPRAELVVIYGESGCGKSFLALNLGMAIAREIDWHDYRVKQGRVVYICAESPGGFRGRVKAYMMRHGITEAPLFEVIDDAPDFTKDADPTEVAQRIGKADVIFVDTLARVTAGNDENLGKDTAPVIARCQALHKATGALIVLIHHSGKSKENGARGWSGLRAAADTEIFVEKSGNDHFATVTKQKDGPYNLKLAFDLPQYVIGQDEDNEDITSCTYETSEAGASSFHGREPRLGVWQQRVMDAFEKLYVPTSLIYPEEYQIYEMVLSETTWDKDKRDTRRQRITEALNWLFDESILKMDGKFIKRC